MHLARANITFFVAHCVSGPEALLRIANLAAGFGVAPWRAGAALLSGGRLRAP